MRRLSRGDGKRIVRWPVECTGGVQMCAAPRRQRFHRKPGHYIAAEVLNAAARLRKTKGKKYSLTIRWTAGHSEIQGNEEVDKGAKKAADGISSPTSQLPSLLKRSIKISRLAAKQRLHTKRKSRWKKGWESSPRYDRTKHIDSSLPSKKFVELISNKDLPRAGASKIFQLRTGPVTSRSTLTCTGSKERKTLNAQHAERPRKYHSTFY